MSLLVHKLLLEPSGGGTAQPTTSHKLVIESGAATSPVVSSTPFPHHVTLAYTNTRTATSESRNNEPACSSTSSGSSLHYSLPFQLQDHNYVATPPLPSMSSIQVNHVQSYTYYTNNNSPSVYSHPRVLKQPGPPRPLNHVSQSFYRPVTTNTAPRNVSVIGTSAASSTINTPTSTISGSSSSSSSSTSSSSSSSSNNSGSILPSHVLSNMPLHRQQFMPQPRPSPFPSPNDSSLHNPPHETDEDSHLSDRSSSVGPSGEETETAPEGEGDETQVDDSITRCICDFTHDDGYMIQCDHCFVWQHVACMELDRNNIPDEYLCEACKPRPIDKLKARAHQIRRQQEIKATLARLSSSDSDENVSAPKNRSGVSKISERKTIKKKKKPLMKDKTTARKPTTLNKKSLPTTGLEDNEEDSLNNDNNNNSQGDEKERRPQIKLRRRKSCSVSSEIDDLSSSTNIERLRSWVEDYEVAVTNHYSPELRARIHAVKINGISADLKASTQGAVLGYRCKVVPNEDPSAEYFQSKILVAATRLSKNTAMIEFQGKYLLASQWNSQSWSSSKNLPFTLYYHMPKEGLSIRVDARTYGNEARFARRSCTPNAEIRHVVERGSLHLYVVSTQDLEENEEILLSLETCEGDASLCTEDKHHTLCCRNGIPVAKVQSPSSPISPQVQTNVFFKKNGINQSTKKLLKKQSPSRISPLSPPLVELPSPPVSILNIDQLEETSEDDIKVSPPTLRTSRRTTSLSIDNATPSKTRRASGCARSPVKSPHSSDESSKESSHSPNTETKSEQKMTREERKIAALMKIFEKIEKAEQRRQEIEKKKCEDRGLRERKVEKRHLEDDDDDEEEDDKTSSADESVRSGEKMHRKGKRGKGSCTPGKRNNSRVDSATSDLTGDEGLGSPNSGSTDSCTSFNNIAPTCGFKFPKTKKSLMNEWLNETVDPVISVPSSNSSADPSGVPTCYMRSPTTPVRRASGSNTQNIPLNLPNIDAGSAKKRWLRQAISEETDPTTAALCPSPNSRPDSPTGGGDYITPLKKRRLARESMSSDMSATPPTTPQHTSNAPDQIDTEFNDYSETKPKEFFETNSKLEFNLCSNDSNPTNIGDIWDNRLKPQSKDIVKENTERGLGEDQGKDSVKSAIKTEHKNQVTNNEPELSSLPVQSDECNKPVNIKFECENVKLEEKGVQPKNENVKSECKQSIECVKPEENKDISQSDVGNVKSIDKKCIKLECDAKKSESDEEFKMEVDSTKIEDKKECEVGSLEVKSEDKQPLESKSESHKSIDVKLPEIENNSMEVDEEKVLNKEFKTGDDRICEDKILELSKNNSNEELKTIIPSTISEEKITETVKCEDNSKENVKDTEISSTPNISKAENEQKNNINEENSTNFNIKSKENEDLSDTEDSSKELEIDDKSSPFQNEFRGPKTPEGPVPTSPSKSPSRVVMDTNIDSIATLEKQFESKLMDTSKDNIDKEADEGNPDAAEKLQEELKEDQEQSSSKIANVTPAPVKRKLSILEYRKRKSICSDNQPKSEDYSNTSERIVPDCKEKPSDYLDSSVIDSEKEKEVPSPAPSEESIDLPLSPVELKQQLERIMEADNSDSDSKLTGCQGVEPPFIKPMKWDASPTIVEQQRENITARLKREFRLLISDDNDSSSSATETDTKDIDLLSESVTNKLNKIDMILAKKDRLNSLWKINDQSVKDDTITDNAKVEPSSPYFKDETFSQSTSNLSFIPFNVNKDYDSPEDAKSRDNSVTNTTSDSLS